jgi:CubicO group peptidase (beta-lactamase class C family)
MPQLQGIAEVEERIRRIEQGVRLDPSTWAQAGQHATIRERMAFYTTPGLSIAVINDGTLEWARGYGVIETRRSVSVTPETIFQACSISKHVALVGALRLVQQGVLDLDEDVNRYLVSWKLPANGAWQPYITIRQLLGHTAGLTQNWYRGFQRGAAIPTLLQVLEGESPAKTPPVRATLIPGSQFRYSGSHYAVLQQVMIDVTKTPFPELMRDVVFEPLGMDNSSYDQTYPETRPDLTAVGHYIGGEPVHGKWRVIPEMAGAGLWTTASDLAQVACEIQRAYAGKPTKVLNKALVDQALTAHVVPFFGLGVQLDGTGASRRFGHGGDNIGYKCLSTAYAEQGLGAVVLTNAEDGIWVALELLYTIAQEYNWPNYAPRRVASTVRPHRYDAYVGRYELRSDFSVTIKQQQDRLYLEASGQPPFELQPSSDVTFFTEAISSEISFEKSDQDKVTGLTLRQEGEEVQAKKVENV